MKPYTIFPILCLALMLSALSHGAAAAESPSATAILEIAGVKGGLVVHIGCGDGRLTAALRGGDSCLVQGLDTSADVVQGAREYIRKLGLYGPVSVDRFDGKRLPYADNLVNLVVAEDIGGVTMAEAMRVLAPGGAAYVKKNGLWEKTIKPHPKDTDEWTKRMTIQVRAMLLADKLLFVAGPPINAADKPEEGDRDRTALLIVISASDGTELAQYQLDSSPVFDGMAAANGRLHLSLESGRLLCMAGQ
jgi:SAM-dependent methyltransferase